MTGADKERADTLGGGPHEDFRLHVIFRVLDFLFLKQPV